MKRILFFVVFLLTQISVILLFARQFRNFARCRPSERTPITITQMQFFYPCNSCELLSFNIFGTAKFSFLPSNNIQQCVHKYLIMSPVHLSGKRI